MAPSPDPRPTAPASGETLAAPRRGHAGFSWARLNETAVPVLLVGVITGMMLYFFNETSDRITRLEERIDVRFAAVDARFAKLEAEIDTRFAKLEAEIDTRFAKLETEIDTRFTKLGENQQEMAQTLARRVALLEDRHEAPALGGRTTAG